MSSALELKVLFTAVDKFVRPVKAITGAAAEAAKALRENTARMKELNRTVDQIDAFKKAEKDAAITANTFAKTRRQIDELKEAITKVGVPTKAQAAELANLTRKSEDLRAKHESLINAEQRLFEKIKAAGVDTSKLAEERRKLASASAEAANASGRLQAALDAENQKMRRLKAAQADLASAKEKAAKLATTGAGIAAAGAAVGIPVGKSVKDFADFETAMLGVARQMDGARDDAGKLTKSYFEMGREIKAMSEKLPMAANDIAAIVEGGARMGIQGKDNLLIYARTTAVMADAFKLPVEQVGEDIGKISQLYKVPIKEIEALGDTINFLDDNALSKGGDIIDVMKRIAGTADMAKMNFKDAAALGSTFLSLGAKAEVAGSASNAMIRELAVAKMQGKRFQGGMAMLGLNSADIQRGMATDATGTIIKVLEKIKALKGEAQLEASTRLFGKEFGDDAAKLASNLDEYRRQLALVNDQKAKGSMQRESDARGGTLQARMDIAKNAFTNLSSDLGEHLKPAIVETLEKTLAIIQAMRNWANENPRLAGGFMTAVKWLAGALAVIGLLMTAAGAILVPLATMKFALVTMGLSGGTLSGELGIISGAFSKLSGVIMATPIGWIIAGIAALIAIGVLLYKHWGKIKAFFSGFWEGFSEVAGPALSNLWDSMRNLFGKIAELIGLIPGWGSVIAPVFNLITDSIGKVWDCIGKLISPTDDATEAAHRFGSSWGRVVGEVLTWLPNLSASMMNIGAQMIDGLITGLRSRWDNLRATMHELAMSLPESVRKVLDIRSPSRVFAEIGMHTMAGLHQGLSENGDGPIKSLHETIGKITAVAATLALGHGSAFGAEPVLPDPPPAIRKIIDDQPASRVTSSGQAKQIDAQRAGDTPAAHGAAAGSSYTYQITINAPAGSDSPALAGLVAREIERIEAARAIRRRSSLRDLD